jgi:hypothetical protein
MHALRKRRANIARARFSIAERGPGCLGQEIAASCLQSLQDIRPAGNLGMSSERLSCRDKIE